MCWRPWPFEEGGSWGLGWQTHRTGLRRLLISLTGKAATTEHAG